jgi:serine/threonine protein kinase
LYRWINHQKKKSAFDLSGDQIGRLLSIGSDDTAHDLPGGDGTARKSDSPEEHEQGSGTPDAFLQVEGYEIQEKVAEAGQGQVWWAIQLSTGREVAIKVPKVGSAASDRARLRFEREIELVARLKHPHIARIYESGIDRGQHYYVMDFVNGSRLDNYVRNKDLPQQQILELMRSICHAIQHAHQMGVLHRDLKPSNILVTNEGHAYVIDFGLAKELLQDERSPLVSMDGETIGTPAYMSPEQAQGLTDAIDTRTDVYSLGVILFGLLTGELPHDLSGSRQQVLRRIAAGEMRPPRDLCPHMDRELEWLLVKALAHDPEQRYASANELAADMDNYMNGRALVAGPPSVSYRVKKYIGRHRALVSSVVVGTLVISICLIASIAMYIRAEIQSQRSQAVNSFLNDSVLSALSPHRSKGGEVTPLSVLDSVASALEGRFPSDPLTEASIRYQLGKIYAHNDNLAAAVLHLQRALEIQQKHLGENHGLIVKSKYDLGFAYWNQGNANVAEPLLSESVRQFTLQKGPDSVSTLYARIMLANTYSLMGQCRRSLEINHDVLARIRRVKGDDHALAILAMANIGVTYGFWGDYTLSEKWLREAVETARRNLEPMHSLAVESMGCLGMVYIMRGNYPEAVSILQDGYEKALTVLGDNEVTHLTLSDLIRAYVAWGRLDKAIQLREELQASQIRLGHATARAKGALDAEEPVIPSGRLRYDEESNTYTLTGGGIGVWHIFDEFQFADKALNGDGTIKARIDSMQWITRWTHAGVMIRDGVELTAKHTSVFIGPGGIVDFQWRTTERGRAYSRRICVRDMTLPYWIKLQRQGSSFTPYHSSDGSNWKEVQPDDPNQSVSVEIAMSDKVNIGLAVTSRDIARPVEALISHVNTTGDVYPGGPFTESREISLLSTVSSTKETSQVDSEDIEER